MAVSLLGTAISFVFGVYAAEKFTVDFLIIFLISFLLVWAVYTLAKRTVGLSPLVCVLAFVVGALLCRAHTDTELHTLNAYVNRYVTVTGRVSEIPTQSGDNTRYVVDAVSITHDGKTEETDERIAVTSDKRLSYNDTVSFTGFLKLFPEKLNENGFDMIRYYKSKNIFFRMYSEDCGISDTPIRSYSVYALANGVKNSISQFIDKYNHGDKAAILKAVLTGNKSEISDELYEVLIRTGTSRCLYPAYLHVMLITILIGLTAGFLKKRYRDILLIAILLLYAVINSSRPVFLRVIILAAVTLIWRRKYGYADFKEMLALTVLAVGVANPLMLYDGGFIISVCAVILVRCFFRYVYGKLKYINSVYVRRGITVGIICTVGLLPLSAYYFGGTSLYSVIASVIFIPPVVGIIISFPIVYAVTLIFGSAPLFSGFMTAMTYIIMYVPRLMDKLIDAYIILPRPSIAFILACAAAITAAGYYVHERKDRARWAALVSAGLTFSVVLSQLARLGTVEVTFVNVGQGDGAVADAPYRGSIIIDGGGGTEYSDYNIGEKIFVPYLETEGITRIEAAFVSHYHKDHTEGVIAAIENLRVKNVFMPAVMPDNKYRIAIEKAASENNTKIHYITEDCRVVFDNGITVEATVPTAKTKLISDDENDTSLMYRVEYGDFSCVFTGDMTSFAEQNLIDASKTAPCSVLKVAHHGSATSTSQAWLDALTPECAVISVGENNGYDLPGDEVLERLSDAEVLRTDENGDIKITADKRGIKEIKSYRR